MGLLKKNTTDIIASKEIANAENIKDYGILIDETVPNAGLTIPFYKGSVEEGHNLPFTCYGKAVVRTARIHPRSNELKWIERHLKLTQLFIGLGNSSFALVLGKPTHSLELDLPDIEHLRTFIFPAGCGVMLHQGTWHDFPLAIGKAVTVLTMNSEEVVVALAAMPKPAEMNSGDVFKIDFEKHIGKKLYADL